MSGARAWRSSMRRRMPVAGGLSLLLLLSSCQPASGQGVGPPQQSQPVSIHRPWVGLGVGLGGVLVPAAEDGSIGFLATNVDVPLWRTGSIRVSAERLWGSVEGYGSSSLRQFSADLFVRRPIGGVFGCANYALAGVGAGIYNISLDSVELNDPTRLGYQLTVGEDCIRGRLAIGGAFGVRFLSLPEHPAFADAVDVALTLSLLLRIRL